MIQKHVLFFSALLLLAGSVVAQPGRTEPARHSGQPNDHLVDVAIRAADGEAFVVYVDGAPVRSRSEHAVDFCVDDRDQTLYIRLKRPEDRIVPLALFRGRIHPFYVVRYDAQRNELVVESKNAPRNNPPAAGNGKHRPEAASRSDVRQLVKDLEKTPMSDDRMALAKSFISQVTITTDQAIEIAETFPFDDDKTDLLIYAYDFCSDKQHYRRTVEAVTFSANKERLFALVTTRR